MSFIPGSSAPVREISDEEFAREDAARRAREEAESYRQPLHPDDELAAVEAGSRDPLRGHPQAAAAPDITQAVGSVTVGDPLRTAAPDPQATGDTATLNAVEPVRVEVETPVFRVRAGEVAVNVEQVAGGWLLSSNVQGDSDRTVVFPSQFHSEAMEAANRWVRQLHRGHQLRDEAATIEWDAYQAVVEAHRKAISE